MSTNTQPELFPFVGPKPTPKKPALLATHYPVHLFKVQSLQETHIEKERAMVDTPERAAEYHRETIQTDERYSRDVETFFILLLNTRRRCKGHVLISTGTLDTVLIHPREVFRAPIITACAAIVLMHNHPSGDPTPSEADIKITRDLTRAGELLKIQVLDHVILGEATIERPKPYVSLRELGYFYNTL